MSENKDFHIFTSPQTVRKRQILQRSPSWQPQTTSTPLAEEDVHFHRNKSAIRRIFIENDSKIPKTLPLANSVNVSTDSGFCSSNFSSSEFNEESAQSLPDVFSSKTSTLDQTKSYSLQKQTLVGGCANEEDFTRLKPAIKDQRKQKGEKGHEEIVRSVLDKVLVNKSLYFLIGRKIGEEFYDVVDELSTLRCYAPLTLLLSYLNDVDLVRFASVSKSWRSTVDSIPAASHRWATFLQKLKSQHELAAVDKKENSPKKNEERSMTRNKPLNVIQNLGNRLHTATANFFRRSPSKLTDRSPPSKYDTFVMEAKKLKKGEHLTKCPVCESPSNVLRVMDKGICTKDECTYEFCVRCRGPFHPSSDDCTVNPDRAFVKHERVGSEASKKNLRRLLK